MGNPSFETNLIQKFDEIETIFSDIMCRDRMVKNMMCYDKYYLPILVLFKS